MTLLSRQANFDKHRRLRQRVISYRDILQLRQSLSRYVDRIEQIGRTHIVYAKDGTQFRNSTRLAALRDLATVNGFRIE